MRLNEHKGKSMWDKAPPPPDRRGHGKDGNTKASESETKQARSPPVASGRERAEEEAVAGTQEEAGAAAAAAALKVKSADPASVLSLTTTAPAADDALARQAKAVARRRSLFSLAMSLAVGGVAWSADAPCLPLLAGLFAVVRVSMRIVSWWCAALRRGGLTANAMALLSLNWFLLGVLTSPMLPGIAHAPRILKQAKRHVHVLLLRYWFLYVHVRNSDSGSHLPKSRNHRLIRLPDTSIRAAIAPRLAPPREFAPLGAGAPRH